MLENIRNALDNGECAVGIFLDFLKAFDTVDHNILLDKLFNYGIRGIGLEWFKVTCQIDIKLLNIITMNQNLVKYYAESPKGLY